VYFADGENKVEIYTAAHFKVNEISVEKPIAVFVDDEENIVYVGSDGDGSKRVEAFELSNFKQIGSYTTSGMGHPAGLVIDEGILYVLDQEDKSLRMFNVKTKQDMGKFIRGFTDVPEQILLVEICHERK